MSGYIQNELIECNRLRSQEALSGNDSNNAVWTNTLSNIYDLQAGDKVSMYAGFVSEKGAGEEKTIEIKGSTLGKTKSFDYIKEISDLKLTENITNRVTQIAYENVSETIELRDNEINLITGYYKNMNGTGYCALPRKFMETLSNASNNHTIYQYPFADIDNASSGFIVSVAGVGYRIGADRTINPYSQEATLRNDNSRYTIFVADFSQMGDSGIPNDKIYDNASYPEPLDRFTIAPEWKTYLPYKEKIKLTIPSGFNSAQFIAEDLTRQLQQINRTTDFTFSQDRTQRESDNDISNVPITRILESNTYKTFNCATLDIYNSTEFNRVIVGDGAEETTWYNNYQTIGIKRPDLFITGRKINLISSYVDTVFDTRDQGIRGSYMLENFNFGAEEPIKTYIEYTKENLQLLKDYIDSQELYPEIWESWDYPSTDSASNFLYGEGHYHNEHTVNNTRIFMMNQIGNASQMELQSDIGDHTYRAERTALGSSNYRDAYLLTADNLRISKLFLVFYNPEYKDVYFDEPDISQDKLTYGCFGKNPVAIGSETKYFINIYPNKSSINLSMPSSWFDTDGQGYIEQYRKWGFDFHFTNPICPAIAPFNGTTSMINYYGETFPQELKIRQYGSEENHSGSTTFITTNGIRGYLNQRYIGADSPKINWDGEHFSISDLHTPENLGSRQADGGRYANYVSGIRMYDKADVSADAGSIVYKLNPLENINEFCPALLPYQTQQAFWTRNGSATGGAGLQVFDVFNRNYEPYQIYDSKSGIIFEDMGFDEDVWDSSIWGILGFTYAQTHGTTNRSQRVTNTNINNLRHITTNAEIVVTDTKSWVTNENGVSWYSDNLPCPKMLPQFQTDGTYLNNNFQVFPEIVQKTTSIQIKAQNFPTSMIKGYYTVRSDIVPTSIFVGGNSNITNMPIVGIIDKMNPQSDYYFGSESSIEFTIGKPMKLSSIRVSIHDPDGSYSNVNDSSAVIFKVQRQMNVNFNIVDEILQEEKKTKK